MSARAIRKLREDREAALAAAEDEDESDSEEATPSKTKTAFALMNDDSSSEDDDADEEDDDDAIDNEQGETPIETEPKLKSEEQEEPEENLDALLEEFKVQDVQKQSTGSNDENRAEAIVHPFLLEGMDQRELDVDFVLRTSLLSAEPAAESSNTSNKNKRRNRHTFLFGNPRDLNLNVKPPHLVGGGIGMSTYDRETESNRSVPWPYENCDPTNSLPEMEAWQDRKRWFSFLNSDSHEKDCQDFRRIQEMGDVNALVLFVAHHPFVPEAMYHLGMLLYQANQAQEGLTFLRRALWVYESATIVGFTGRFFEDQCFMDYHQPENQTYFNVLFQLARVNQMAGLSRAAFAVGRYLLSLDPLRDPKGILLALDAYALSSNAEQWLVDLYESKRLKVFYRDQSSSAVEYQCDLSDVPGWSYSYALALFRLNDTRPSEKANQALKSAINEFPLIVDLLLNENDVDMTSRSCRMDWQAVIDYTGTRANAIHGSEAMNSLEPVVRMATEKAYDLITRVYSKLNHKLWASDQVMLWLHSNLEELKRSDVTKDVLPLSPALMRYSRIDPGEYEMKFQLLPAEANPLDLGLVQHALVIDPNRRRFLRNQRVQRGDEDDNQFLFGQGNVVRPTLLGPPQYVIDLDWPMLEIFWRSLLPWNRIDEIPRPRP